VDPPHFDQQNKLNMAQMFAAQVCGCACVYMRKGGEGKRGVWCNTGWKNGGWAFTRAFHFRTCPSVCSTCVECKRLSEIDLRARVEMG